MPLLVEHLYLRQGLLATMLSSLNFAIGGVHGVVLSTLMTGIRKSYILQVVIRAKFVL